MSRKGVEEILNEQLRTSNCFEPLDEFYEEFKRWQVCIRNDVKKFLSSKGKRNGFPMPTTPAASLRKRPRLSVITESPADNIIQPVSKFLPKNSKNGNDKRQPGRARRSNRIKLAFDVSDEEIDDTDDTKSIDSVASSSQQVFNSCANISQLLKSKSSFDCGMKGNVDESHNKEESNEKTINKSKKLNGSKRNTRSIAGTSRNVGSEILESEDQHPVDVSPSVAPTLLSEPVKEDNGRIPAEQKESTRRKGRSKNHSIISHNKRFTASKRNTRSNARTSQNASFETVESQDQHPVDVSPSVAPTSLPEPVKEDNGRIPAEQKESTTRRKGRSKNHSIIGHNKRFTSSKKSTRSNARTSQNASYETVESQDQHPVDVSLSVAPTSLPEPVKEDNDNPAEQKESTTWRKERSKNHSIIDHNKRFTASNRNTKSNARTSQNVSYETVESQDQHKVDGSPIVFNTSISEPIVESIDRVSVERKQSTSEIKGNSENQSIVDNEKLFSTSKSAVASSNVDYRTSDRISDNIPKISNIPKSVNKNNLQEQFFKNLAISIIRIDETIENTQHPVKITEEVLRKCSGNNISITSKKSPCKNSDETEKKSLEKSSLGEKRKRELTCSDIQRPSKKNNLHENDQENKDTDVVENGVKERTRSSLRLELCQNQGCTLSVSPERKSRKFPSFSEVVSFSQLTSSISNKKASKGDIFENSIDSSEEDKEGKQEEVKDNTHAKAESGSGNSIDSEVECSEYYSVGSDVDADDVSKTVREDVNTCNSAAESEQRQSRRKKKAATKPNTPDTRASRKGAHAALFSPYANEPVKNRVAAYEILSSLAEEIEIPVTAKRVTRTKTRAMAAAAAAAAEAGMLAQKNPMNNSNMKSGLAHKLSRASLYKAKKRLATAKKNDASKENSFVSSAKNTGRTYNFNFQAGGKILADVNGLSTSQLNSSRKTPMTGQKLFVFTSANQSGKSGHKPGVVLGNVETFIKKNIKPVQDVELKKMEEQKKREEKEREAQRRREELLRKQAEEKKKKRDEMRLRVQEKREAQEKEKQESQLRVGKEKTEKWNIIQQEREAKQKGNVLKKKLETERKAAEAKRKLEEAETAKLAKLKMEELQHKKEQEEAEKERQRRLLEEKEAAFLREKVEQKMRVKPLVKLANEKYEIQKNTNEFQPQVIVININDSSATKALDSTVTKPLDSTFTKPLDSTFTKPLDSTFTKPLDSTFTKPLDYSIFTKALNSSLVKTPDIPTVDKLKASKNNNNNAYNLEDLPSGDSDDETEDQPKKIARWACRPGLLLTSKLDEYADKMMNAYFCTPKNINFSEIFPNKRTLKRTSSAIWHTPPRYSCLPKY